MSYIGSKSIGPQPIFGNRQANSVYFVICPPNIDLDQYKENCLRTNTVSITNENGDTNHQVRVTKLAMREIEFPQTKEGIGSEVLTCLIPYRNELVVFDVLFGNEEFQFQDENEQVSIQRTQNNTSQISVNADQERVLISSKNIEGEASVDIGSDQVNINARNQVNINSSNFSSLLEDSGQVTLEDETQDNFKQVIRFDRQSSVLEITENGELRASFAIRESGITYSDQYGNEIIVDQNNIRINGNEAVNLGTGDEPILLGRTLVDIIDTLLNEIASGFAGPYPFSTNVINAATQARNQLESALSEYSFTQ